MKLKALIKQKQLKLSSTQRQLRRSVAMERWLLNECSPSTLMEWSHCKRADPEATEPDMSYKDPTTSNSLPRPSQAAQIEIARQDVGSPLCMHNQEMCTLQAFCYGSAAILQCCSFDILVNMAVMSMPVVTSLGGTQISKTLSCWLPPCSYVITLLTSSIVYAVAGKRWSKLVFRRRPR